MSVWGDALSHHRGRSDGRARNISQNAITDAFGDPLLLNNTDYSVRVRIARSSRPHRGHVASECLQSYGRADRRTGLAVTAAQVTRLTGIHG